MHFENKIKYQSNILYTNESKALKDLKPATERKRKQREREKIKRLKELEIRNQNAQRQQKNRKKEEMENNNINNEDLAYESYSFQNRMQKIRTVNKLKRAPPHTPPPQKKKKKKKKTTTTKNKQTKKTHGCSCGSPIIKISHH